jgi:hypothetical protein
MELAHRRHGHRSVCFFTDRRTRARFEGEYPLLRSPIVEARYDVDLRELRGFADFVRSRHEIAGVLPFNEEAVIPAARLSDWLAVGWNTLETMLRFRDKYAFKQHIRETCPHIRMNASRLAKGIEEVLASGLPPFARYVLKPNDGLANRDIAVFDETTPREVVESFMNRARSPLVLEEYVDGVEYFVNGQVGAHGDADAVAAFRYSRVPANGRANIDYETRLVRHSDPTFEVLDAYAREIVRASGLRRSPFHIEIKIDERGPCLIEMGARLPGNANAQVCNALHGDRLDVFAAALHGYVRGDDFGPLGLDWPRYDSTSVLYVHGIATRRELIYLVEGAPEVERLCSFAAWVKKPVVGERIVPTVSSLTMPWCVLLMSRGDVDVLEQDGAAVRSLLRINARGAPARHAAAVLRRAAERGAETLKWQVVQRVPMKEPAMSRRPIDVARDTADSVIRRLQRKRLLRGYGEDNLPELLTASRIDQANEVMRWTNEYIGGPHPQLGRKGPICPFVHKTVLVDRLFIAFHDEIDGSSRRRMRGLVLAHAERLKKRLPETQPDGAFTSVVLVFPNLPDKRAQALEDVFHEIKSDLMASDVMSAAFHKHSTKPSMHNPDFQVYRAPFPCFVLRHMDVRDIMFLGHNRPGFERYRTRFEERFAKGQVSNEFGYVDLFQAASERFPRK